jgi:hypothetical protein
VALAPAGALAPVRYRFILPGIPPVLLRHSPRKSRTASHPGQSRQKVSDSGSAVRMMSLESRKVSAKKREARKKWERDVLIVHEDQRRGLGSEQLSGRFRRRVFLDRYLEKILKLRPRKVHSGVASSDPDLGRARREVERIPIRFIVDSPTLHFRMRAVEKMGDAYNTGLSWNWKVGRTLRNSSEKIRGNAEKVNAGLARVSVLIKRFLASNGGWPRAGRLRGRGAFA